MVNIDETLKLTQGQGHKVKGQGQICNNVKITCKIDKKINGQIDVDDTYTYCLYWLNVKVDLRLRSQGQRSRSNLRLRKKIEKKNVLKSTD